MKRLPGRTPGVDRCLSRLSCCMQSHCFGCILSIKSIKTSTHTPTWQVKLRFNLHSASSVLAVSHCVSTEKDPTYAHTPWI